MSTIIEKRHHIRIGILLHGNKIWLSEILSYFIAALVLGVLLAMGIMVLRNELIQTRLAKSLHALQTEMVQTENDLTILQEKVRIHTILTTFAKKRVSDSTILALTDLLHVNSRQFGYDPLLLLAVMKVESVFDPKAQGRFRSGDLSGALGLMQLKLATAQETAQMLKMPPLSPEDLLKPDINMLLGTAYLTKLISRFRSFKLGIIAYNIGPEKVVETMRNKDNLPMNYYKKVILAYFTLNNYLKTTAKATL
jgi:soluble lytic murein transglycosylase-like protein